MGEFVATTLRFPVVLFTFLLAAVILYWIVVALGVSEMDVVDTDAFGLGGVPLTIAVSLLVLVAWFAALVGTVFLVDAGLGGPLTTALSFGVLLGALLVGLLVTRLAMAPLHRMFPEHAGASRADFLGRTCVVRTGQVDETFGQAEVTAADGSSAVIQVRKAGDDALGAGDTAVIYDYDPDGEFFWISPVDSSLTGN
ncbi:hypothetical protein [Actinokineospora sp. HUAS TT18]|uniref:hypothetical protein n=1 Tax=Actinokineospora sp. HUAS TT18 TaxID=3447451 RepID=UPI003F525C9D